MIPTQATQSSSQPGYLSTIFFGYEQRIIDHEDDLEDMQNISQALVISVDPESQLREDT